MGEHKLVRSNEIVPKAHLIVEFFEKHPTATVGEMCKEFNIVTATYYNWCKIIPDLKEKVQEAKVKRMKSMLEKAENILDKALDAGDIDAAKFAIKEYGEHRERNANNATGNTQIGSININIVKAADKDKGGQIIEVNGVEISSESKGEISNQDLAEENGEISEKPQPT